MDGARGQVAGDVFGGRIFRGEGEGNARALQLLHGVAGQEQALVPAFRIGKGGLHRMEAKQPAFIARLAGSRACAGAAILRAALARHRARARAGGAARLFIAPGRTAVGAGAGRGGLLALAHGGRLYCAPRADAKGVLYDVRVSVASYNVIRVDTGPQNRNKPARVWNGQVGSFLGCHTAFWAISLGNQQES